MTRYFGVIGHRSWIAKALITKLITLPDSVTLRCEKTGFETTSFSHIDCLFIFSGRSNPTVEEMDREKTFLRALAELPRDRAPKRTVWLGSRASINTTYGAHKAECERIIYQHTHGAKFIINCIRVPAVFGPGQPADSNMLIPSLGRVGSDLELLNPHETVPFVFVNDLADHLVNFCDEKYQDPLWAGGRDSLYDVPGTFRITPQQLANLKKTWESK